jgi:hypothetical protein
MRCRSKGSLARRASARAFHFPSRLAALAALLPFTFTSRFASSSPFLRRSSLDLLASSSSVYHLLPSPLQRCTPSLDMSSSTASPLGKRTRSTTPAGSPPPKRAAPSFTLTIATKSAPTSARNVTASSPSKSPRQTSPVLKENNPTPEDEGMAIDQPAQLPLTPSKRTKAGTRSFSSLGRLAFARLQGLS